MNYLIRPAQTSDAREISEIYRYYVLNTAITFDTAAPDEAEFKEKIAEIQKDYPFLVIDHHVLSL